MSDAQRRLSGRLAELDPSGAGRALEPLSSHLAASALEGLEPAAAANVLAHMSPREATQSLLAMGRDPQRRVVGALPPDLLARLLRSAPAGLREPLVDALPSSRARAVQRLLAYADHTAGAHMATDPLVLPVHLDVGSARARVLSEASSLRYYAYVVDDAQHLLGVVSLRQLWTEAETVPLRSVMHTKVERVPARATAAGVLVHPGWTAFPALRVVDAEDRLVGVLTHEAHQRMQQADVALADPAAASIGLVLAELYFDAATTVLEGFTGWVAGPAAQIRRQR